MWRRHARHRFVEYRRHCRREKKSIFSQGRYGGDFADGLYAGHGVWQLSGALQTPLTKRNFLLLKKKRLYTNFYILMAYSCALIF